MDKMFGWTGSLLRIDLSKHLTSIQPSEEYVRRFIGGRAVAQWILFDELNPDTRPLDPDNILIFDTGPLTGTLAPAASRVGINAKNVFSKGVGWSNAGGHFGPEMKFAGFDFLIIRGRSKEPVYLWIKDGQVEFRSASDIWGRDVFESENIIRKDLGDRRIRVAGIGPAGENLVKAAAIMIDKTRAAGGCGLGAVMGSKNLKAVAVRGSKSIEAADPDGFAEAVDDSLKKILRSKNASSMRRSGTQGTFMRGMNELCAIPVRNAQDDHWDERKMDLLDQPQFDRYETRKVACFGCPIYCSHYYVIHGGQYDGVETEGFEANLGFGFGSRFDIEYAPALIKIQELLSRLGLDNDNTSVVLSWAFECFEKGILTKESTDGLELKWGDYEVVVKLVRKLAFREGIGNLLAKGVKTASEEVGRGSQYYATQIKGQEMIESIRSTKGWGLGIALSSRAARHLNGAPTTETINISAKVGEELFGIPTAGDGLSYEGKGKLVCWMEQYKMLVDMLQMCYYTSLWLGPDLLLTDDYANLLSKLVGVHYTSEQLMNTARRAINVEKAFNTLHAGFTRKDDYLPERFYVEPIKTGKFKGEKIDREEYDRMLDEYYESCEWDSITGVQTQYVLRKMDLIEVLSKLEKYRRIN
jgi:aldehyde:ferredoxin oxidoreductase